MDPEAWPWRAIEQRADGRLYRRRLAGSKSVTYRHRMSERRAPISGVAAACIIGTIILVAGAKLIWITSPYWGHGHSQIREVRQVGALPAGPGGDYRINLSPNRIEIPALKAQAPIVRVGTMPNGELQVPLNPRTVGWWAPGARPGAARGTAIFAGHINYAGVEGTFADIGKLKPGDQVMVFGLTKRKRTEVVFKVTGVRTYHKTHLPYRELFDQNVPGRMVLVTCGGPFDASTGNYLDNVVAFGLPVASRTF